MWLLLVVALWMGGSSVRARATEILKYTESRHSRTETGNPGHNVTGTWSWVDSHGERHHIWYVADADGFRAFGDVVPNLPGAPIAALAIGVPVVVGGPLLNQGAVAADSAPTAPVAEVILPLQGTLQKDIQAVGIGRHDSPGKGTGSSPKGEAAVLSDPLLTSRVNSESAPSSMARISGEPSHDFQFRAEYTGATSDVEGSHSASSAPSSTTTSPVTIPAPQSLPAPPSAQPVFASQHVPADFSSGKAKSLVSEGFVPRKREDELLQPPSSANTQSAPPLTQDNNFVSRLFSQLTSVLNAPVGNSNMPPSPQETSVLIGTVDTSQPEPVIGSNFVLIDRLQIPTNPKPRVGSRQLVPQPVRIKGQTPPVITGLHTSGRPPRITNHQSGRALNTLGIHLLNLPPRSTNKSSKVKSPVPRPTRITGEPNLENYYSSFQSAFTTPPPFRLPKPTRDYDYFYDYSYYDYGDYDSGSSGGPVSPSHKVKGKPVLDLSDENSAEGDSGSPDSDEKDD